MRGHDEVIATAQLHSRKLSHRRRGSNRIGMMNEELLFPQTLIVLQGKEDS